MARINGGSRAIRAGPQQLPGGLRVGRKKEEGAEAEWLREALSGTSGVSASARANALHGAGVLAWGQDDYRGATETVRGRPGAVPGTGGQAGHRRLFGGPGGGGPTAQGQPERAARLFGAVEVLREVIGAPLQPSEQAEYERNRAAVCATLGHEAFSAAWAAGRKMSLEEAIGQEVSQSPPRNRN